MKQFLLSSIFLCISYSGYSQDVIVKKDGSTILSKVLEVSSSEVKYKKYSNQDGPIYSISSSNIQVINYENGEKETFGHSERRIRKVDVAKKETKDYNTVYAQWNPSTFKQSVGESFSFTGLSLGYSHGFNLISNVPLFLEVGAGLQYSFYSDEETLGENTMRTLREYGYKGSSRMWIERYYGLSLKVPVNISYKHYFPNSDIAIAPYVGLSVRGNLIGKYKLEPNANLKQTMDQMIKNVTSATGWSPIPGVTKDYNLFSEDDMGEGNAWKRIQIGWQVGANVFFSAFYAGVSYGTDFTEIAKDCKIKTLSVTLGYSF